MTKVTITILLNIVLWRQFRMACIERGTSAGKEIGRLIQEQLAAWQHQPQKETDHA